MPFFHVCGPDGDSIPPSHSGASAGAGMVDTYKEPGVSRALFGPSLLTERGVYLFVVKKRKGRPPKSKPIITNEATPEPLESEDHEEVNGIDGYILSAGP